MGRGIVLALFVIVSSIGGCDSGDSSDFRSAVAPTLPALAALGSGVEGAVVAQGRLEPADGVVPVVAPVGEKLVSLDVDVGDIVRRGQTLGELKMLEAKKQELAAAEIQLEETQTRAEGERAVAQAKLDVAKIELRKAELELAQAMERFELAEAKGGQLDLLRQGVVLAENKLQQLRDASGDPTAGRLVSTANVDRQELEVDQARAEWQNARLDAQQKIEGGKLSVEAASQDLKAAELAIEAGKVATPLRSLRQQIELLELQLDAVRLVSPIEGTVLAIEVTPGAAVTSGPILYLANTSRMVCRAEVNVAELRRIDIGAEATISSPALSRTLRGSVASVSRIVGSPTLQNPYPMARVDWRSAEVMIDITEQDRPLAAELIHLQVDVAIAADGDVAAEAAGDRHL